MTDELDRLEALARAATPGEWAAYLGGIKSNPTVGAVVSGKASHICLLSCSREYRDRARRTREQSRADASFIAAANPASILRLIDRVRELEECERALKLSGQVSRQLMEEVEKHLEGRAAEPVAYISDESIGRLLSGGNGSKGTVPVHAFRTTTSRNPLYTRPPRTVTDEMVGRAVGVLDANLRTFTVDNYLNLGELTRAALEAALGGGDAPD